MPLHAFVRFDLRTTDVDAARRFYADAIGLDLDADTQTLAVWELHEQARARGAPAHWLGSIGVEELEAKAGRLRELGSESLGPPVLKRDDGISFSTLRDPLGAPVAVREAKGAPTHSPVAWHQLSTTDVDRAWQIYSELFAWSDRGVVEIPGLAIENHLFAWEADGQVVGGMANTARLPGVHTHWQFFFPVADLDQAIEKIRANGGNALPPSSLSNGARLAAAEDPQGAAFGILQPASS